MLAIFRSRSLSCSLLYFLLFGYAINIYGEETRQGFSADRLNILDNRLQSLVDEKQYAGFTGLIVRNNRDVHKLKLGWQDRERQIPMKEDTIFRIYSMSKAITSIAALILYEQGMFMLDDPVAKWIPAFDRLRVYKSGQGQDMKTVALERAVTVKDLFIHTSGLTYHFLGQGPVHRLYRQQGLLPGVELLYPEADDGKAINSLAEMVEKLSGIPLLHQPGERMSYSVSIDVLGHLVEIISGKKLDAFLRQHIFEPLDMKDTGFTIPTEKLTRFAANYSSESDELVLLDDPQKSRYRHAGRLLSGGAGLVSTARDYMQFQLMILNQGKWNGKRILGRKTLEFALSNHFPRDNMPRPAWMKQQGHGLGFALALEPSRMTYMTSPMTADWAGAASTFFWIDRKEKLAAVFMTQMMPIKNNSLIEMGRVTTYQSLVD